MLDHQSGPKSNNQCCHERCPEDEGSSHVKMEAEMAVMWPQAKG
jgi:hypothetical protein